MAERQLEVIPGALPRGAKPKIAPPQDALARRWRYNPENVANDKPQDVIPLLDGWIRRLEREAGAAEKS